MRSCEEENDGRTDYVEMGTHNQESMECIRGSADGILSVRECAGYMTLGRDLIDILEGEALRWNVDEEGHLEEIKRGVREQSRDRDMSGWPHGLHETTETTISGEGPGPARKKK